MPLNTETPSLLEPRFHRPDYWVWETLDRGDYSLRYGFTDLPEDQIKATIAIFPGLSEFSEKYFELIRELADENIATLCIDWRGQGLSSRYMDNPHMRHTQGLKNDAKDALKIIQNIPSKLTSKPLITLAHSMGGNIALHSLKAEPNLFKGAAFMAPLCGLHTFQNIPDSVAAATTQMLKTISAKSYAPLGGDWNADIRDHGSYISFSSDTARAKVHNAWMLQNPNLQVGHITNEWLHDAHQACLEVQKRDFLKNIDIPIFTALAGHEYFVDNKKARQVFLPHPSATVLEIPDARHEIFMEKNHIRAQLINNLYKLVEESTLR